MIFFVFLFIIFNKQFKLKNTKLEGEISGSSNADISKPKFAINNESKKIYITANEGNFLNKDEVMLRDNVRFKSNDFSIETNKVIFDRNKQTAQSNTSSFFKAKNTTIFSEGFDIHNKGNTIIFYGNSFLVLK
tara:strand:- start:960 stop:1358 length:399 start_codon:yes stop_codon:yes gene_type:complete